ncbi:hypothetical protein MMC10_000204 [Thelotrema lepadinum]|nr:hypothetical protein [Thelotrema lepadinum]
MSFLSSPRLLFAGRGVQLGFGLGALIVIAWCNTHPGPWINITGPVALGVIASLLTILVTVHGVFAHIRSDPFAKHHGRVYTLIRVLIDIILFLFWIGTATLLIRPQQWSDESLNPSYGGSLPPTVPWTIGEVFSFVEIVAFAITAFLVFWQNRGSSKSGGGTGTSAAYV